MGGERKRKQPFSTQTPITKQIWPIKTATILSSLCFRAQPLTDMGDIVTRSFLSPLGSLCPIYASLTQQMLITPVQPLTARPLSIYSSGNFRTRLSRTINVRIARINPGPTAAFRVSTIIDSICLHSHQTAPSSSGALLCSESQNQVRIRNSSLH